MFVLRFDHDLDTRALVNSLKDYCFLYSSSCIGIGAFETVLKVEKWQGQFSDHFLNLKLKKYYKCFRLQ